MCNMNSGKNCMRNYNFCTLKVLDNYHENKAVENFVGRQGSEEDSVLPEIVEDVDESAEIENLEANSNCGTLDDFGSFSGRPASSTGNYKSCFLKTLYCIWVHCAQTYKVVGKCF